MRFIKRLFILTLCLLLLEVGYALDVPDFMMVPKSTWVSGFPELNKDDIQTEIAIAAQDANLGLRLVHLKKSYQATKLASEALAENGVIESGDILLSFRPAWVDTLAYAHVQLGISHAALAFVVEMDGKKYVHSLESPISYSSFLDSPHQYGDLEAFHIVRPTLTEVEKSNLKRWAKLTMSHPDRFAFFSDYGTPMYKRGLAGVDRPIDQVRLLAKVIKEGGPTFSCYCSEFVWTFLGLRKCSPDEFPSGNLEMFFDPLKGLYQEDPKAGLTQGPDAALRKSGNPNRPQILTAKVAVDFLDSPSDLQGRMSSGHQAVARANKPKMDLLKRYYGSGEPAGMVSEINQGIIENFSPTAFLIRSHAGLNGLRYAGTVVFDK
jgi:hypothetical protein